MPRGVSSVDLARLQGRLWTPHSHDRVQVRQWYSVTRSPITTVSGLVSAWGDISGLASHASSPNAADQPSIVHGVINGKPALRYQDYAGFAVPAQSGLTSAEVFWVGRRDTDPAANEATSASIIGGYGTGAAWDAEPYTDGGFYSSCFRSAQVASGNVADSLLVPYIMSVRSAASDWAVYVNGSQHYSTGTSTFTMGATPIVGAYPGGTSYGYLGYNPEVLLYGAALSTRERQIVEGYLAWEWTIAWRLPASHPYKNRPPLIGA